MRGGYYAEEESNRDTYCYVDKEQAGKFPLELAMFSLLMALAKKVSLKVGGR